MSQVIEVFTLENMSPKKMYEELHKCHHSKQSKHGKHKLEHSIAQVKPVSDLDLSGLMNGKLLEVTNEIVKKADQPIYSAIPQKIKDYCAWLPELAKYGPLPKDCKTHIQAVYHYLTREDKDYIKGKAQEIRTKQEPSQIETLANSA